MNLRIRRRWEEEMVLRDKMWGQMAKIRGVEWTPSAVETS